MTIETVNTLPDPLVHEYFDRLVGRIYKILPLKEEGKDSTTKYIRSLWNELCGCEKLMQETGYDAMILEIIATLRNFDDKFDELELDFVRGEVFKLISICKKIRNAYRGSEEN